ncbi:astakine-like [Limulus polyphemus]|uniref:Astakine-like n=1 Tax=Limulus polyphemus TaxID=6850 RepID=A0ABM1B649_LIMPO|nr:astakine-like [Limulus polyphemus]
MRTLVATIIILVAQMAQSFPGFRGCRSQQDCDPGSCCVVAMERFSTPRCQKLSQQGEYCRPRNSALNTSLSYPNGILDVTNLYTVLCPCDVGLICEQAMCQPNTFLQSNHLA